MSHLSLVALIAAFTTMKVASVEDQCKKKLGEACDPANDKPCFTTASLFGVQFWVHLECNGIGVEKGRNYGKPIMQVASGACKSVPAEHGLRTMKVGSPKIEDVKCSDDIKAAGTIDVAGVVELWKHEKFITLSMTKGIKES